MHDPSSLSPARRGELRALLEARARMLEAEVAEGLHRSDDRGIANRTVETDEALADLEASLDIAAVSRDAGELADIRAALARIGDPAFGLCASCGTAIPWARLRAQPQAIRCRKCADALERSRHPRGTREV